jgi:hypothetical protein
MGVTNWLKKLFKKKPELELKDELHRQHSSDEWHETIETILTPTPGAWRGLARPLSPAQQSIKEVMEQENDRIDNA